jgi:hypothetical protein
MTEKAVSSMRYWTAAVSERGGTRCCPREGAISWFNGSAMGNAHRADRTVRVLRKGRSHEAIRQTGQTVAHVVQTMRNPNCREGRHVHLIQNAHWRHIHRFPTSGTSPKSARAGFGHPRLHRRAVCDNLKKQKLRRPGYQDNAKHDQKTLNKGFLFESVSTVV